MANLMHSAVRNTSVGALPSTVACKNNLPRTMLLLGTGIFLAYAAFLPPGFRSVDGRNMLAVADSLASGRGFTVPPDIGVPGQGGYYYSAYYPLLSIVAAPFVAAGNLLTRPLHLPFPEHYLAAVVAVIVSTVITSATACVVAMMALRVGSTRKRACLSALLYAFGTIAFVYSRSFFAEPLLALLTALALYISFGKSTKEIVAASILSALAVLAKPPGLIVGIAIALYLLLKRAPIRFVLLPLAGVAMGSGLYLGYNYLRFGDIFHFGTPSFGTDFLAGFTGLLFSPSRGLLWYSPAAIVALVGARDCMRQRPKETVAVVAVFALYLFLYSFWSCWFGGSSWGPRFLLPALPGLVAISSLSRQRRTVQLLAVTALATFAINCPNLFCNYERFHYEERDNDVPLHVELWSWKYAPLVNIWRTARDQVSDSSKFDPHQLVQHAAGPDAHAVLQRESLKVVPIWWTMLPLLRIPVWIGAAAAACMLAVAGYLIRLAFLLE